MDNTVAVLFKGQLAYYKVSKINTWYEAVLLRYNGYDYDAPPKNIAFEKRGRNCNGTASIELMNDLWEAVKEVKAGTGLLAVMNP